MDKDKRLVEWLGEDNDIGIDIWKHKYQHNNESFDEWLDRVSGGNEELRQLIAERKFLFGGRTLANRGIPNSGNYFNCFSAGFIPDDYAGIMDKLKEVGITFKSEGGQGVSMSKLRPKGAPIGEHYQSDGIIPFIEMFNCVTQGTSQGGSRKGALMISLDARHKEAMDFINLKTDLGAVTKANLSLEIDDEFMEAVEAYYLDGKTVTLHERREYSGHVVEYDIIPINIYKRMMEVVWDYGEPGCIFTNKFRDYNFLEFDEEYQIDTCNPCGEQPLKSQACCNLGSLNLYEFVEGKFTSNAAFDFAGFTDAIRVASQALDDIIDENANRLPKEMKEYADNAKNWRNIGLGVFGYADMLMALGLKYGSGDAIDFTDSLFSLMMRRAIYYNQQRWKANGSYPKCKPELVYQSKILRKHSDCDCDDLRPDDFRLFRNCSLLSIAPTGSIGTMMGLSGGIEPEFALSYTRRTDNLKDEYKIEAKVVKDYRKFTGNDGELPDYFVASADIPWKERIRTQATIQDHIDTAISSTINLPKETTKEEIEELYLYAWQKGLKGVTIFRDGCKRLGILTTNADGDSTNQSNPNTFGRGDVIDISDDLIGKKRKLTTGCGSLHCLAYFDPITGDLMEVYLNRGSTGGCANFMTGLSRMVSHAARLGGDIDGIVDQLNSCGVCPSYATRRATKHDTSKGACCPIAVGHALKQMWIEVQDELFANEYEDGGDDDMEDVTEELAPIEPNKPTCPECGEELIFEGGCNICKSCGFSRCD